MLRSINRGFPQTSARPEVEVPLDAAKTKLEDCQRDIGKNLRSFPDDCLNWVLMLRPPDQSPGAGFLRAGLWPFLKPVAGQCLK